MLHAVLFLFFLTVTVFLVYLLERYIVDNISSFAPETASARAYSHTRQDFLVAFKIALLAGCFVVLPLGDYSLSVSEFHPDLVDFQLLGIASPDWSLFVPFIAGFFYLLSKSLSTCFTEHWDRRQIIFNLSLGLLFFVLFLGLLAGANTTSFRDQVYYQAEKGWTILNQPVGALLFLIAFFLFSPLPGKLESRGENIDVLQVLSRSGLILFISAVFVILYFGGWMSPFENYALAETLFQNPIVDSLRSISWFFLKTFLLIYLLFQLKLSLPRLRFDQLLRGIWGVLLPLAVINYFITASATMYITPGSGEWIFLQAGWLIIFLIILWRLKASSRNYASNQGDW